MHEIQRQIARARRRLWWDRFFQGVGWALFAGLLIAAIGIAVRKIWYLALAPSLEANWNALWLALGLGVAAVAVFGWCYWRRISTMDAALELDRRFRLKERLSSAVSLAPDEMESEAGEALLQDAVRRAESIEVRDQFAIRPRWTLALPLVPAILLLVLSWVPNAAARAPDPGAAGTTIDREQIKVAVEQAKKKIAERLEKKTATGLKDALEGLEAIDRKIDKLSEDSEGEKKSALAKLNNIRQQVADEQSKLGGAKNLRESLKRLSEAGEGPAKKIAEAMKAGDLEAAKEAVKELARRLKQNDLSPTEKKQLAEDLQKLAQQLKKMADQQQQQEEELQRQIQQARQEGNLEKAAELQQKLDQLKQNNNQQQMQKMAEQLQKCAECMNPGEGDPKQAKAGGQQGQDQPPSEGQSGEAQQQAGQALEDLAQQLEGLQQQLEDLEDLEDLQADLNQLKQNMQGMPGAGGQDGPPQWQDFAQGEGNGGGKRADEEGETGNYRSKVDGQLRRGQTVVTGNADGANRSGRSEAEVREAVNTSMNLDTDPLENQRLPRSQREHAQQYFEKMRKGN